MLRQDKVADDAVFRRARKFWRKNRWVLLTSVPAVGLAFFIARGGG